MQFAPIFLGAVKAVGSIVTGFEESANLKERERVARLNQLYAQQNSSNELRIATADAESQRRRGNEVVAEQATAFAQSGFSVADSATQALEQSAREAELDALTVQYKGSLRSRAYQIESEGYRGEAEAAERARKMIPLKTAISAGTNLLSGYASQQGMRIS